MVCNVIPTNYNIHILHTHTTFRYNIQYLKAVILERLDSYFFPQRIKDDFIKKLTCELSPEVSLKLHMLR